MKYESSSLSPTTVQINTKRFTWGMHPTINYFGQKWMKKIPWEFATLSDLGRPFASVLQYRISLYIKKLANATFFSELQVNTWRNFFCGYATTTTAYHLVIRIIYQQFTIYTFLNYHNNIWNNHKTSKSAMANHFFPTVQDQCLYEVKIKRH